MPACNEGGGCTAPRETPPNPRDGHASYWNAFLYNQGSHSDWKNGKAFSSQGKVREF